MTQKWADVKIVTHTDKFITTQVWVDGVEFSDKVSAVTFKAAGGELPVAVLEFPIGNLQVVGSIIVKEGKALALWRRLKSAWKGAREWLNLRF